MKAQCAHGVPVDDHHECSCCVTTPISASVVFFADDAPPLTVTTTDTAAVTELGLRLLAQAERGAAGGSYLDVPVEERTEGEGDFAGLTPETGGLAQALRSFGDRIAQAVGDPGSIVGRKLGPSWGFGNDGYSADEETVTRWSTRAVLQVLTETAIADAMKRNQRLNMGIPVAEEQSGGAAALRADVATYDDGTFYLTEDQLCAVRELLALVHYDELAMSWLVLLPIEFRSRGEQQ